MTRHEVIALLIGYAFGRLAYHAAGVYAVFAVLVCLDGDRPALALLPGAALVVLLRTKLPELPE